MSHVKVIVHRCLNGRAPLYLSDYTVSRPPLLTLGHSCVPATVNFLQYLKAKFHYAVLVAYS